MLVALVAYNTYWGIALSIAYCLRITDFDPHTMKKYFHPINLQDL
jgi:hypothetical protein